MATFTNQAVLTYNGRSVSSNVVTGELVTPLTLSKSALSQTYNPGGDVTYVVSIVNTGSGAFDGLTLTDDLGGYAAGGQTFYPLAYVSGSVSLLINGTLQPAPTVSPGPPLVISGLSVPAGGNAVILYEAALTDAAPLASGSEIENTVTLTGPGIPAPLTAQASVAAAETAELRIDKGLSPASVEGGGQLTYTFTVRNTGNSPATAEAGVAISDVFDPVLQNLSVALNGTPLALTTDYTYDPTTGQFNTVAGRITVPAATFAQEIRTGVWQVTPGEAVLTVTGTV